MATTDSKTAYSQLERASDGLIKVVFYDTETGLPLDNLAGYTIVAVDDGGSVLPVNEVPTKSPDTLQPASTAQLPQTQNTSGAPVAEVPTLRTEPRENKGSNDYTDTGPLIGGLGALNPMNALGKENADGNTGWRNKALTTALSVGAGALIGGPVGAAVGFAAKGIVNSDKFKNKYNDSGQLSNVGVGMGLPKAPQGPQTEDTGFGVTPSSRPAQGPQQASVNATDYTQAPSMGAFNREDRSQVGQQTTNIPQASLASYSEEPNELGVSRSFAATPSNVRAGSFGRASEFNRNGLNTDIGRVVDNIREDFGDVGINSGYRSPEHNAKVGGAKNSQHTHGNAVDISLTGMTNEQKRDVLEAAVTAGAKGVGIYPGGRSLHVDTRKNPTSWGPSGFTGSSIDSMPEWSRDTLKAMYGAGVGGNVGPRIGPTPTSRETALAQTNATSKVERAPLGAVQEDLAFTSRPDFSRMTPGQIATSGFGKKPSAEQIDAMAYTLAGELDPKEMNNPKAVANLAATINNRIETAGIKATFDPSQYNSLTPGARRTTEANYSKFGDSLRKNISDFYDGKNKPEVPDATHYYNPSLASPAWGSKMSGTIVEGNHKIGNIPGEYETTMEAAQSVRNLAEDNFTSRSLASQVGRNVENIDKNISKDARTSFGTAKNAEAAARERQKSNPKGSLEGSRYDDGSGPSGTFGGFANSRNMSTKTKDDNVGTKSSSSGKSKASSQASSASSGSKGFANSKSMSTRSKDDNVSTSKASPSKSPSSSKSSSGGFANSQSMSTRSKDDDTSKDSKSSKSSSSKSSSSKGSSSSSSGSKGKK